MLLVPLTELIFNTLLYYRMPERVSIIADNEVTSRLDFD